MANPTGFDQTQYYELANIATGPNLTLAVGKFSRPPRPPMLDDIRSHSSENWQFFYNDGIYFIRNYNYGAAYQLGVEPRSSTTRMLLRGPGPEMQWNITRSGDGWLLKNMLLGDNYMLGVDGSVTAPIIPLMSTESTRAVWTTTINLSAGQITDQDMLDKIPLESSATVTASPAAETSPTATPASDSTSPSTGLGLGPIIGISIGGSTVLSILLLGLFILVRRRRRYRAPSGVEIPSMKSRYPYTGMQGQNCVVELTPDTAVPELSPNEWKVSELPSSKWMIPELPPNDGLVTEGSTGSPRAELSP